MSAPKPPRLPTDPNARAHAILEQVTGPAEPKPLPSHVKVSGDTVTCERCGESFRLSKRGREPELRGFGSIHEHRTPRA